MNREHKIAVCSRSFSKNEILRSKLLEMFKHVKFNDIGLSLSGDSLVEFLDGYDGAIIALETLDEDILSKLPRLKFIGKYGVGLDKLDLDAMARHDVSLGWTAGVNARNVAEYTLTMVLNMLKNIPQSMEVASSGRWDQIKGYQLSSMTYGILGCGHVGKALARLLKGFGCRILINDIKDLTGYCNDNNIEQVSLIELLERSDVLSIHIPKNTTTIGILDEQLLRRMKRGSYVVNSARGGLIKESVIIRMLDSGHFAGVALDVLEKEPPSDLALINHPGTMVTTHIAGSSHEAIYAMGMAAIEGLQKHTVATDFRAFQ